MGESQTLRIERTGERVRLPWKRAYCLAIQSVKTNINDIFVSPDSDVPAAATQRGFILEPNDTYNFAVGECDLEFDQWEVRGTTPDTVEILTVSKDVFRKQRGEP